MEVPIAKFLNHGCYRVVNLRGKGFIIWILEYFTALPLGGEIVNAYMHDSEFKFVNM